MDPCQWLAIIVDKNKLGQRKKCSSVLPLTLPCILSWTGNTQGEISREVLLRSPVTLGLILGTGFFCLTLLHHYKIQAELVPYYMIFHEIIRSVCQLHLTGDYNKTQIFSSSLRLVSSNFYISKMFTFGCYKCIPKSRYRYPNKYRLRHRSLSSSERAAVSRCLRKPGPLCLAVNPV